MYVGWRTGRGGLLGEAAPSSFFSLLDLSNVTTKSCCLAFVFVSQTSIRRPSPLSLSLCVVRPAHSQGAQTLAKAPLHPGPALPYSSLRLPTRQKKGQRLGTSSSEFFLFFFFIFFLARIPDTTANLAPVHAQPGPAQCRGG